MTSLSNIPGNLFVTRSKKNCAIPRWTNDGLMPLVCILSKAGEGVRITLPV